MLNLTHFSRSRTSYFTVLCSKVWTDYLTLRNHFLSKQVDSYVGILGKIHNDAKSPQYRKVNFNLYKEIDANLVHFTWFPMSGTGKIEFIVDAYEKLSSFCYLTLI